LMLVLSSLSCLEELMVPTGMIRNKPSTTGKDNTGRGGGGWVVVVVVVMVVVMYFVVDGK